MLKGIQFAFIGVLCLLPNAFGKERPELDPAMHQLFNSLINLQIMSLSPERFSDSEGKEIIKKDLDTLAKASHSVSKKVKGEEPGMTAVLSLLQGYIKETQDGFNKGNTEFARQRVKTMGSLCLSCHSRNMPGWDFEDQSSRVGKLPIKDFEKVELYAATRQFDKAVATARLFLETPPKTEMDFLNYTRVLRNYMILLVRVKQDAAATKKGLSDLTKIKGLPEFDMRLIKAWQKDADFWVKDKVKTSDLSPDALYAKAESLVLRAASLHAFPSDENGDISYLRATSYLHEMLEKDPSSKLRGKALYLLGVAYGAIKDPSLWDIDTLFFEQCVRENPHTAISRQCYERYVKTVYLNQPLFADSTLSNEALKKLGELAGLAAGK